MQPKRFPWKRTAAGVFFASVAAWYMIQLWPPPALVIGPETTRITGPRTQEGRLDYAEALHLEFSRGVTPETNAAVLLNQVFGIESIPVNLRAAYERRLGQTLPPGRPIAVELTSLFENEDGISEKPTLLEEFEAAYSKPWQASDLPRIARWLEANAEALTLIEEASRRAHYYSPLVTQDALVQGQSTMQEVRAAARMLAARAMLRVASGETAAAWADALALHRLSRLTGQRPTTLLQQLISFSVEATAFRVDQWLVTRGLSADAARSCLRDYQALAVTTPVAPVAQTVEHGERLVALDTLLSQFRTSGADMNALLRRTNQLLDEVVAGLNRERRADRVAELNRIAAIVAASATRSRQPLFQISAMILRSRRALTEAIGSPLLALLIPSYSTCSDAETRTLIRGDLVSIGLALAAYRAEHNEYPESLDALVPDYLPAIPQDRFRDAAFNYQHTPEGFQVYSVGPNGTDDGGRSVTADSTDDITFASPPAVES